MPTINNTDNTILTSARSRACLEAAWELDALARMLPGQVTPDVGGEHLVVRGIAARILALASVLMSAIDEPEDMVSTAQLENKLFMSAARQG